MRFMINCSDHHHMGPTIGSIFLVASTALSCPNCSRGFELTSLFEKKKKKTLLIDNNEGKYSSVSKLDVQCSSFVHLGPPLIHVDLVKLLTSVRFILIKP